jgi:hypothetical protein
VAQRLQRPLERRLRFGAVERAQLRRARAATARRRGATRLERPHRQLGAPGAEPLAQLFEQIRRQRLVEHHARRLGAHQQVEHAVGCERLRTPASEGCREAEQHGRHDSERPWV